MSKRIPYAAAALALLALAGCHAGSKGGVFAVRGRSSPDEFVVGRSAPLVIPPDFALVPPRPGAPRPQDADSSTQALNALFGGPAQPSQGEAALLQQAGPPPEPGIRSEAGAPATEVVNKGAATRDIIDAPASTNAKANASTPSTGATPPSATPTDATTNPPR